MLPPLLVVLVALVSVGLHVRTYTLVGPIDELQHIDYLYKSPELVRPGDRFGDEAMEEEACRGLDYSGFELPPCVRGGDYDPDDFQEAGYNTASANTPLYYTITHALAAPLKAVATMDSLVTAGRLVGGLWLSAGLLLAYAAARRLGAGRWASAAVLALLACTPAVVYPSATITPDAATFAVGAGALLAALWWEERPARRWPVLAVVTVLALAIKMTNITVLVAIGLAMLIRLVAQRWSLVGSESASRPDGGPARGDVPGLRPVDWVVGGVTLAVTALVVAAGWQVAQGALTHGDLDAIPMNQKFKTDELSIEGVIGYVGQWLTPLSSPWAQVGRPEFTDALQRLSQLVVSTGFVAAAVIGLRALRERSLAWAVLLTGLTGASLFIVVSFVAQGLYVPPPARYGYALVPTMAVLTATGVKTRPATVALCVLAVGALVFSVLRLV
ncbi:glycosyltransferase family 39 protein [Cellulomonas sp.]|uniref:glycosyltransferase family 39 protein n=1 Tax=Cellulomonas sp. TaxID=40001 RepID=UPI001B0DCFC4|nr:glycosyltransferase family 39 protein [Cellulomonas sp.]MBO9556665.1 glycosyltransferase family 39 protein [Cellulomonas sp.]